MLKRQEGFVEIRGLVDIEAMAASLAAASDLEQGVFFNVFFEALRLNCGDEYRYQMQKTFIAAKLSPKSVEAFAFIGHKE